MAEIGKQGLFLTNYPTPKGAFEVYFMGVLIYSKLMTKKWPRISDLANKCGRMYRDYQQGLSILEYEITPERVRHATTAIDGFRKRVTRVRSFDRNGNRGYGKSFDTSRNHTRSVSQLAQQPEKQH